MLPIPRPTPAEDDDPADGGPSRVGNDNDAPIGSACGFIGDSLPSRSTGAAAPPGPGSVGGVGDLGAGHRPGRAAARSNRFNVGRCTAALFSREFVLDEGGGSTILTCAMDGNGASDLDIGRGGEGVRSVGEVPRMSKPPGDDLAGVRKEFSDAKLSSGECEAAAVGFRNVELLEELMSAKAGESNDNDSEDGREGLRAVAEEEWKSKKSPSSNASDNSEVVLLDDGG